MVHSETVFWLTECLLIRRWEVHMVSKTACRRLYG